MCLIWIVRNEGRDIGRNLRTKVSLINSFTVGTFQFLGMKKGQCKWNEWLVISVFYYKQSYYFTSVFIFSHSLFVVKRYNEWILINASPPLMKQGRLTRRKKRKWQTFLSIPFLYSLSKFLFIYLPSKEMASLEKFVT